MSGAGLELEILLSQCPGAAVPGANSVFNSQFCISKSIISASAQLLVRSIWQKGSHGKRASQGSQSYFRRASSHDDHSCSKRENNPSLQHNHLSKAPPNNLGTKPQHVFW